MRDLSPRQRQIIEESIRLIAHRGIQALTVRNVARKIGISEPAIYRHFESKTDILLGVLDVLELETAGKVDADAVRTDPTGAIADYFEGLLRRFGAAPELAAVIFADEVFLNEDVLAERVRELMDRSIRNMETLVVSAQEAGRFRSDIPSRDAAIMIVGAMRLIVRRWHLSDFGFDLSERAMEALASMLSVLQYREDEQP